MGKNIGRDITGPDFWPRVCLHMRVCLRVWTYNHGIFSVMEELVVVDTLSSDNVCSSLALDTSHCSRPPCGETLLPVSLTQQGAPLVYRGTSGVYKKPLDFFPILFFCVLGTLW